MRVLIAEDQYLLRTGVATLLASHDVEVTAAVESSEEILPAVEADLPDLALLDIRLPPTFSDEGLRMAVTLRERWPGLAVVLLSQHVEHVYLEELLADGGPGIGYLLKDRVIDDVQFVSTLRSVAEGGTRVDPSVISRMMEARHSHGLVSRLTPREVEVLAAMAEGESNRQIAQTLFITEKAVARHINNVFAKLDLPPATDTARRVRAVLTYLQG